MAKAKDFEIPPANQRNTNESCTHNIMPLSEDEDNDGDSYRYVESSHPLQLLSGLNSLRLSAMFCDVTICVEEASYLCHRLVLASCSPYFKAMFSSQLAESKQDVVVISGVEPDMMKLIIDYAYTSEVVINKNNVQSLLAAANQLEILPVRDACCSFMERNMDVTNCIGIHCFAEAHACTELQVKAKDFILRHFPEVCRHDEILSVSSSKLIELISDDDLNVDSEEVVFTCVIAWYHLSEGARRTELPTILEHVRLPLLSPYFLYDCVGSEDIVRNSPKCRQLLKEAIEYHLLEDRRSELQSSRTRPRNTSGVYVVHAFKLCRTRDIRI